MDRNMGTTNMRHKQDKEPFFPFKNKAVAYGAFLKMDLDAAIKEYGNRGECLRVERGGLDPVYLCLDGVVDRWARRNNSGVRVCFTVREVALILDKQRRGVTVDVDKMIEIKRAFPLSEVVR